MQNAGKSARAAGSAAVFALIGLPFLGFGCFMGHKTVLLLLDWHAAKAWVQADAEITSIELEERGGDDSPLSTLSRRVPVLVPAEMLEDASEVLAKIEQKFIGGLDGGDELEEDDDDEHDDFDEDDEKEPIRARQD